MSGAEHIAYLLRLSEAKSLLMGQLLQLTKQQSKLIDQEDVEGINGLIQQKQELMGKVDVLDGEFLQKYELLKTKYLGEIHTEGENGGFGNLQEKIRGIMKIVEEIQKLDNQNAKKMQQNLERVKKELKGVKTSQKVVKGYGNVSYENPSVFIDKKR